MSKKMINLLEVGRQFAPDKFSIFISKEMDTIVLPNGDEYDIED